MALRRALPLAAFCIVWVFVDFLSEAIPMRLVWYLPLEHRFTFDVRPLALAVDFYGRVLVSLLAGGAAWLAAAWVLRSDRLRPTSAWLRMASVWLVGLLIFTSGLYLYVLKSRQGIPVTLPEAYVPR